MAITTTKWPSEEGKFYLHIIYREWFVQADTFQELFDWIIEKYQTEKWWDYDPFMVCEGTQPEGNAKPIDWKARLTDGQRVLLDTVTKANFEMV